MSGSHHHVLSRRIRAVLALPVVAALLATGCGTTTDSDRAQAFPADLAGQVDQIMKSHIDAGLIPGAAVSIIDPEHGNYSQAYGVADTATGRRAQVSDHYRVGSITKTFVATAVLHLADAQKLSLDDPLRKYVAAIPNGDTITVRDLLGMRGGVYDFATNPEFFPQLLTATPDRVWSIGDALRIIRDNPDKAQPPNSRTAYSNSEYLLLGLILEKVTGRPVRDIVNDLASDYGLHDTRYPPTPLCPHLIAGATPTTQTSAPTSQHAHHQPCGKPRARWWPRCPTSPPTPPHWVRVDSSNLEPIRHEQLSPTVTASA